MKLSVPSALSERAITQDGLLSWINDEAVRVLRQVRQLANYFFTERKQVNTAGDGAYTRIWTSSALPTDACWVLTADVAAVSTSGAAQRAAYEIRATVESTSSAVAQVGSTTSVSAHESTASIDARFAVDGTLRVVYLEGRDDATSPMRFTAVIRVNEA